MIIKTVTINPECGITGKGRPRVLRTGRTYTPKKTKDASDEIRDSWPWDYSDYVGELIVNIAYHKALPKSAPKKRIGESNLSKPDLDNVAKLVLDALNGKAYNDDAQITRLWIQKLPRTRETDMLKISISYVDE